MKTRTLKSDSLLLLAAAIWGFAFVAQRVGMDYIGPFSFNGIRFILGGLSLLGFSFLFYRPGQWTQVLFRSISNVRYGVLAGVVLFCGASLQQIGIQFTTAGKAGFITGFYVILVPILGIFLGKSTHREVWVGAVLALLGLYLLSLQESLSIGKGDSLVFLSAFFWAIHVHLIDYFTTRAPALPLAIWQFLVCGILSLFFASFLESMVWSAIFHARWAILYAGLMSTGIAYTLQVVAQKEAHPTHAGILLSLESVFAVVGGSWLLQENLTNRQLLGCAFMLGGMILSQMRLAKEKKN